MSDERNRLGQNDDDSKNDDDVEAHRLQANDEGASNDEGDDDVEAHVLKK